MYIPANVYPIMTTTSLGQSSPSTIVGGVVELIQMGSWPVAVIIFIASVIVPVGKLVALAWLCLVVRRSSELNAATRTRLYRLTEFIGRWSMIDVFVVAILVALIRAGSLMSIEPGPAALAFGAVVVITMVAAMTFDPRLLWDSPLPHSERTRRAPAPWTTPGRKLWMSEDAPRHDDASDTLDRARATPQARFSPIWIVPIVALLIGASRWS